MPGPSIMTPISQMQGLWMDCVWYSSGVFSCTMKKLGAVVAGVSATTRAAMVLSCMVALFGLCLASLGLKCTRWGGSHRAKGHTAIAAGGCFVLASFLCLVPASWFTSEVITAFLTTDLPDSSKISAWRSSVRDVHLRWLPPGWRSHFLFVVSWKENRTAGLSFPRRPRQTSNVPRGTAETGAADGARAAQKPAKQGGEAADGQSEAGETGTGSQAETLLVSLQTPSERHQGQLQPAGVCLILTAERGNVEFSAAWLIERGGGRGGLLEGE
ncbi:Claudin-20 [Nibea albiflora]|nr:Claudin-20 [Nibea albiflora]